MPSRTCIAIALKSFYASVSALQNLKGNHNEFH